MSHIASITIDYGTIGKITVPELIEMYIQNGWNLNDFGHIALRPLGDIDDFNWVTLELNQKEELYKIIRQKVEANEDPAVVLMLNNTGTGAVTTFFPKKNKMDFLLMFGRKRHPELPDWTDFNWYLPYILKPLNVNKLGADSIEFLDMI